MKRTPWQVYLGVFLAALSLVLYVFQIIIFHDVREELFLFFQDLAFVPIEVLLVTLIVKRFLTEREKRNRLTKMNMVIGTFFNEAGTGLIERYFPFIPDAGGLKKQMLVRRDWTSEHFNGAVSFLRKNSYTIDSRTGSLESLKQYLAGKRMFLLLENPNLLEHDTFSDLLWAVFHLADELERRPALTNLPEPDYDHLSVDMRRAYSLLLIEWLFYMKHLKKTYPYLFSLAVRINPFDSEASAVITG